jgi:integrase
MIEHYIESKRLDWTGSTHQTEQRRLRAVERWITGDALYLWDNIQHQKPYSRLVLWVRVTDYWNWMIRNNHAFGTNPYYDFKKNHPKLFRNVYQTKKPTISFEEARARITNITDERLRLKALQLLEGGLRFTESLTVSGGKVRGKGGKLRPVYVPEREFSLSYRTFHRRLIEETGLRPHELRKIFATRLAEEGAGEFDLLEIMGWSDLETAKSYVRASRARELVNRVQRKDKNAGKQIPKGV